jgi:hypothetical protein
MQSTADPAVRRLTVCVCDDGGVGCHVSKESVLSPRLGLPVGAACGLGANSRLGWPFGLRASRAHWLLSRLIPTPFGRETYAPDTSYKVNGCSAVSSRILKCAD